MENNKPPRLAEMECGAAATFQRIRAAYRARKSPQRSPTRASCAALVNALFWKILVTRVKSFFGARKPAFVSRAAQRECNEWCAVDPGPLCAEVLAVPNQRCATAHRRRDARNRAYGFALHRIRDTPALPGAGGPHKVQRWRRSRGGVMSWRAGSR